MLWTTISTTKRLPQLKASLHMAFRFPLRDMHVGICLAFDFAQYPEREEATSRGL